MTLALASLRADEDAYPAFLEALQHAGLPINDLDGCARFYAGRNDGAIVAFGGLEGDGPDQLLRSVVVPAPARGGGYGRQFVQALMGQAHANEAERLWLLTISADGFFARLGWTTVDRASAPEGPARVSGLFSGALRAGAVFGGASVAPWGVA